MTRRPLLRFQELIARPEASLGLLVPEGPLLTVSKNWLNEKWQEDISGWMSSSLSEAILVTDSEGFGSKHLSSYIITRLQTSAREGKTNKLILSIDISSSDVRRKTECSLLYTLIRQIIILRPNSCQHIEAFAQRFSRPEQPHIPCGLLWGLLSTLLQSIEDQRVFLIIHGVGHRLQPFVHKLVALPFAWRGLISKPLKVFITSSERLDLPREVQVWKFDLGVADCRVLSASIVQEKLSSLLHQVPAWVGYKDEILEKVFGEESTHRTAMLRLSILEQGAMPSTENAIQDWLSKPIHPPTENIHALSTGIRDIVTARTILNWVSYAMRPLSISELSVVVPLHEMTLDGDAAHGLRLDSLGAKISSNLVRDLERGVKPLIVVDGNQRVALAHPSLREYLEQHKDESLRLSEHHAFIASQCLRYLRLFSYHKPDSIPVQGSFKRATAFFNYAQHYWVRHYFLAQPPNEELDQQVLSFITSPLQSSGLKFWVDKDGVGVGKERESVANDPLLLAIRLGLSRVIRMILERDGKQLQPERLKKALITAAKTLELRVIKDILALAPMNVDLLAVLCEAAAYGNVECVGLILDRMGDSWDECLETLKSRQEERNPLLLAASGGHTSTVELLITRGCSILSVDNEGNTALHLAAQIGDADTLAAIEKLQRDEFKAVLLLRTAREDLTPCRLACRVGSLAGLNILFRKEEKELTDLSPPEALPKPAVDIATDITNPENLAIVEKLLFNFPEPSRLPLSASRILADVRDPGNLAIVERILFNYPEPLPAADILADVTSSGNLAIIKKVLLQSESSIRWAMGTRSRNCFGVACMNGYYEVARLLVEEELKSIEAEPDLDEKKRRKATLNNNIRQGIHIAIEKMNDEMVIWLWEKMDAPSPADYFETALWTGNLSMLDYLFSRGEPVGYNFVTEEGIKSWIQAVKDVMYSASLDTLRYLLKAIKGAGYVVDQHLNTIKAELVTLFIRAVKRGHVACLRELFREIFVQFSMFSAWGTILEMAVTESDLSCLREVFRWQPTNIHLSPSFSEKMLRLAMERKDVQYNSDDDDDGNTQKRQGNDENGQNSRLERVRILLASGILASSGEKGRAPPLHFAVERGITDVIELLLQQGANPNLERQPLQTPMHVAIQCDELEILALLLRHGGDPNAVDCQGQSSLHLVIQKRDIGATRLMLVPWIDQGLLNDPTDAEQCCREVKQRAAHEMGKCELSSNKPLIRPDVNKTVQDECAATPLILAAQKGLVDAIGILLLTGANPNVQNRENHTPLYTLLTSGARIGRISRQSVASQARSKSEYLRRKITVSTSVTDQSAEWGSM